MRNKKWIIEGSGNSGAFNTCRVQYIYINDVGVKSPFDTMLYGFLRVSRSRNPKNIRNALIFLRKMATFSCFLGPKVMHFHASMKRMTFWPLYHHIVQTHNELRCNTVYHISQNSTSPQWLIYIICDRLVTGMLQKSYKELQNNYDQLTLYYICVGPIAMQKRTC